MIHTIFFAAILGTGLATAGSAAPGGKLDTLDQGTYICSLPGDASGSARQVVAEEKFVIATSSTYSTDAGWGTYLLTGNRVAFSRGPMKGARYLRESDSTLRKLSPKGGKTQLRCTRWYTRSE